MPCVVAVGSPNWDTMAYVPDSFLSEQGLPRGDATPFSESNDFVRLKASAAAVSSVSVSQCGGCACNTAKVLACLGCDTAFCGSVGSNSVGQQFQDGLAQYGVKDLTIQAKDLDTGEVLCLVTPDGERTFAYRTGVASDSLVASDLCGAIDVATTRIGPIGLVYFDIYTFLCPENTAEEGILKAHALGAKVGINLGSSGIVRSQQHRLWGLLEKGYINVIFLNEDEALALTSSETSDPETFKALCQRLGQHCEVTVLTLGSTGLWTCIAGDVEFHSATPLREVVDSTGAGDFFAGGFLSAWLRQETSKCDGKSFLDIEFEFKDGVLKASKTLGSLPEAVGVSAEIERVEIFGLRSALKSAEVTSGGKVAALPPPRSRPLDSALQAAVIKVKPFIDMKSEWQLSVK
eukprot:symbB.v1.2.008519.t1/scaffold527.1/size293072/17